MLSEEVKTGSKGIRFPPIHHIRGKKAQLYSSASAESDSHKKMTTPRSQGRLSFPWQLHTMLGEAEQKGFAHIVSWQLNGTAFRVHHSSAFAERVMPLYFNQTKYKSFSRQLHIYGFQWISKGPFRGSYYHPKFLKGEISSCLGIYRRKVKHSNTSTEVLEDTPDMEEQKESASPVSGSVAGSEYTLTAPTLFIGSPELSTAYAASLPPNNPGPVTPNPYAYQPAAVAHSAPLHAAFPEPHNAPQHTAIYPAMHPSQAVNPQTTYQNNLPHSSFGTVNQQSEALPNATELSNQSQHPQSPPFNFQATPAETDSAALFQMDEIQPRTIEEMIESPDELFGGSAKDNR